MPEFDRFLHATIGTEQNGMDLSVLSLLARQNLDPWEAARQLSLLAREPAVHALSTMLERGRIGTLPVPDMPALASSLVSLLQMPTPGTAGKPAWRAPTPTAILTPAATHRLQVIIGITLVMLTLRWLLAGMSAPQPGASQPPPAATTQQSVSNRTEVRPAHE
jgi:hypothetical protein